MTLIFSFMFCKALLHSLMTDSLQKWKNKTKQTKKENRALTCSHERSKMTNVKEKEERREDDPMMSN